MLRPIVRFGAPVIHERATLVTDFTPDLQQLIDDMIETMYAAPGIGLAAPQIGIPLRIFVADVSSGRASRDLVTLINPTIEVLEGTQSEQEGCLSIPGFNATVERASRVVVSGLTREGDPQTLEATGLQARAFQHEIDHLDGLLFVDHLRGIKRELILRKIRKLQRTGKW